MFHYSILNKENCRRSSSGNSYRMVGFDWLVNRDAMGPAVWIGKLLGLGTGFLGQYLDQAGRHFLATRSRRAP